MDKVDTAIKRLQTASEMSLATYGKPMMICISGGKDSGVLLDLALRAGIPIEVQHSHTTADAPETVRFIRQQMHELECAGVSARIDYPVYKGRRTSLWQLMRDQMFPPTRLMRYCCSILKETAGRGHMVATGVRWDESTRRASGRGIYENHAANSKKRIVIHSDNAEDRRIFEQCNLRGGMRCNPIVDWTDREIWDYTADRKLPVNPLYGCGFGRVGCVGCPMAGKNGGASSHAGQSTACCTWQRLRILSSAVVQPGRRTAPCFAAEKVCLPGGWKTGILKARFRLMMRWKNEQSPA